MVEFEMFEKQQKDGRDGFHNDLFVPVHINPQLHALEDGSAADTKDKCYQNKIGVKTHTYWLIYTIYSQFFYNKYTAVNIIHMWKSECVYFKWHQ